MKAQKWDFKKRKYEPCELPRGTRLYSSNMGREVSCAQCGERLRYGDCYTSLIIHNKTGFGYPVCEKCHNEEKLLKLNK